MRLPFCDTVKFVWQFGKDSCTIGAVAPSSRFLAKAITSPIRNRPGPARILEVGPGTGAVTRQIVQLLHPDDWFDLVEINHVFAKIIDHRFQTDHHFLPASKQSKVHVCRLQDFEANDKYDFIISGLPLNNFTADQVSEIFEAYLRLLAPGGVLSYFEYMFVRPMRMLVSGHQHKANLKALGKIINMYQERYRFQTNWVFVNIPPAWVQHLQSETVSTTTSCK